MQVESSSQIGPIPDGDADGIEDIKRTAPPVGRCIYCGEAEGKLTDEHVIPFFLQGNLILPKASCSACQKETARFEQNVARGPLHAVRRKAGFQSRTKHADERPQRSGYVTNDDTGAAEPILQDDMPVLFDFPIFPPPRMLSGVSGIGIDIGGVETAYFGEGSPEDAFKKLGGRDVSITTNNYRHVSFARMLIKIAYGFAWSKGQIERLHNVEVTDTIRGIKDNAGDWVGTLTEPRKKYPMLHRFALHESGGWLICEVQLFSDIGAPCYGVLLGKISPAYKP